jgi:hypothetical protein
MPVALLSWLLAATSADAAPTAARGSDTPLAASAPVAGTPAAAEPSPPALASPSPTEPASLPDARLHALATHSLTWKLLPLLAGVLGFASGTVIHHLVVQRQSRAWPQAHTDFVTLWIGSLFALGLCVMPVVVLFGYWGLSDTTTAQLLREQGSTPYLWTTISTLLPLAAWLALALFGGSRR